MLKLAVLVALVAAGNAVAAERLSDVSEHWFPINAPGLGFIDACKIEATYARAGRTFAYVGGHQFTLSEDPGGPDEVANAIDQVCYGG